MDILWITATLLLLAAALAWLTSLVRHDGLGDRRPPQSHHAWDEAPAAGPHRTAAR